MISFKKKIIVGTIAIASVSSLAFVDNYFEISKNLDIMTTAYRELNTYYVDDIDPAKLMRTGIEAMVESLDPYTNYISESDVEDYRFMTTGQYGGVGATIFKRDNGIVIREPYEGYPAYKAGLRAGDMILEIDGKSLKGKNTSDVSKFLKGQPNTPLKLRIMKAGETKESDLTINREEIQIENVPYYGMVNDHVGYIQLKGFTQDANKEVKNALLELKKNPNLQSVILDVRGNPGGLLHEAVNIANIFIPKNELVVNTKGKVKDWEKAYRTLNTPVDTDIPLAVLTSSSSASASEIVSGVMQDLDRGVIVGQRTYGKGLVQSTRPLSYNAQLKITTAKYYIPSGRCIQAIDYSHRNEDGSVGKVPDSLIREFKTRSGRKVFDGGGVAPDFAIEAKQLSNISISLLNKNLIFDFATAYRLKNPSISNAAAFKVSDAVYQEFVDFLKGKEYDYKTKSEKLLEDYKEAAQKEKYYDAIASDFNTLQAKMMHDKDADLQKYKTEIKQLLEEEIASRYYFQKGRIQVSLANDPEVAKAIQVLDDKSTYLNTLKNKN